MSVKDIELLTLDYSTGIRCTDCMKEFQAKPMFKYGREQIYCMKCFFGLKNCSECQSYGVVEEVKTKKVFCDAHAWAHFNSNPMNSCNSYLDYYEYGNSRYLVQLNKALLYLDNKAFPQKQEIQTKIKTSYNLNNPEEFYSKSENFLLEVGQINFPNNEISFSHLNATLFTLFKLNKINEVLEYIPRTPNHPLALKTAILYLNFAPMDLLFETSQIKDFFSTVVQTVQGESIDKKRLAIFGMVFNNRDANLIGIFKTYFFNEDLRFNEFFYIQQDLSRYILYLKKNSPEENLIVQYHYIFIRKLMPSTFQAYNFYSNAAIYMYSQNLYRESKFFSDLSIKTSVNLFRGTYIHLTRMLIILANSKFNLCDLEGVPQLLTLAYENLKSQNAPKEDLIEVLNIFIAYYNQTNPTVSQKAQNALNRLVTS